MREITILIAGCIHCPYVNERTGYCRKKKVNLYGKIKTCPFPEVKEEPGGIPNLLKDAPLNIGLL